MEVGEEVEGCVLEVEGEVVRLSLNPALVEGCQVRREGEEGRRRRRRRSSGNQPPDVSRTPLLVEWCNS